MTRADMVTALKASWLGPMLMQTALMHCQDDMVIKLWDAAGQPALPKAETDKQTERQLIELLALMETLK